MRCFTIKKIEDKTTIEGLDKEALYIPPSEKSETMDNKLLEKNYLKNSKDEVGYQYPIKVAVSFEDLYKDSQTSEKRVHMRPLDGRHRYLQDPNWPREYYECESLDEFYQRRFNLDIKKKSNPNEWKKALKDYGNHLYDVEKVPLEKIGSTLCKRLTGVHKTQILRHVPPEWKDTTKANNRTGKTKKNYENIHEKCEKTIEELKSQIEGQKEEMKRKENELENQKTDSQKLKQDNYNLTEYIKKLYFHNPGLQAPKD